MIKLAVADSVFSTQYENSEVDLDVFIKMADNPIVNENKNTAPYILPWEVLDTGNKTIENAGNYNMIMIDYDDGVNINDMLSFLTSKNYNYLLYTTHSHKPEHHKFRVFIPLKQSIPGSLHRNRLAWRCFKDNFINSFPECDKSSFNRSGFYLPNHKKGCEYLTYNYTKGESFMLDFTFMKSMIKENIKIERKERMLSLMNEDKKLSVKNSLTVRTYLDGVYMSDRGNGCSNLQLYKALYACVKNNDEHTLEVVIDKAISEKWTRNDIQYKINQIRGISTNNKSNKYFNKTSKHKTVIDIMSI